MCHSNNNEVSYCFVDSFWKSGERVCSRLENICVHPMSNSVQLDIRTGHDQTIDKILNWIRANGDIESPIAVVASVV